MENLLKAFEIRGDLRGVDLATIVDLVKIHCGVRLLLNALWCGVRLLWCGVRLK